MLRACTNDLVMNQTQNFYGFVFSDDFDTSQAMEICDFMKDVTTGCCNVVRTSYCYDGVEIPVLVMGSNATAYCKEDVAKLLDGTAIRCQLSDAKLTSMHQRVAFNDNAQRVFPITIGIKTGRKEYQMWDECPFYVYILSHRCILFVANPFPVLMARNEFFQHRDYKIPYGRVRREKLKTYLDNIEKRQALYVQEIGNMFDSFAKIAKEDGLIYGSNQTFGIVGYALIAGTKEDLATQERGLFPYKKTDDNYFVRFSNEELDTIERDNNEYNRKTAIVKPRLAAIRNLLREKGLTYTIISEHKIVFDKKTNNDLDYMVWMNAQMSDGANYGWFDEKDFIDWLNMDGIIPFPTTKINHFGEILEKLSDGFYHYRGVKPKTKPTCDGNYDADGLFVVDGKEVLLTIDEIKEKIQEISPIIRFTKEDFEKVVKNLTC